MLASGDEFSDLLIFKRRGMSTEAAPQKVEAPAPQAAQQVQQPQQPQQPQQLQQPAKPIAQPAKPKIPEAVKAERLKDVKSLSCINHPWRSAYAYCAVDGLPYCFVDLIEFGGKTYCLNDIDSVLRTEGRSSIPVPRNGFSMFSSALLFVNAAVLYYYTQSQTSFIYALVLKQGVLNFLLSLNALYIFPIADVAVMALGIMAAVAILKKSYALFGIAFIATFVSLVIMVYQYFSSSVGYAFLSSVILLIAVTTVVYSRMSSVTTKSEKYLKNPEVDWPMPEVF